MIGKADHPGQAADYVVEKILGIDRSQHPPTTESQRLVSDAREALDTAGIYLEDEPSVKEWLRELWPSWAGVAGYTSGLFPSAFWIRRYNLRWLLGDVIAGVTVGLVVVPQAMAYADLAQLPPAYGLYTSFTGAALYWLFGTSKDIVIGTTAVGSLLVGQVIGHVQEASAGAKYTNPEIAHALSLFSGAIMLLFGILRLGWIIEFIPYIPISAFVTAASITIMSTQIPVALGIPGVNTREAPYKVLVNTLRKLPEARLDAAIGVGSIVLLFALREACGAMERRQPLRKRMWSTLSSLRLTFTMLLFTLISYLVHRTAEEGETKFRIVGKIEAGFQATSVPKPDMSLIRLIVSQLPAITIILIIEHIAIAKSMGRIFNYSITPSQEIVALGAANVLSPFVGGYVCTGSFGASAVLSKSGVRTPLAGLLSAVVLILALYVLTGVFYYIPKAALAGLIIHAVCNLMTPPDKLCKYWKLSPIELLIWVAGVVLAVFKSLEIAIYVGIILSVILLLVRTARTKGQFMGVIHARRVVGGKSHALDGRGVRSCDASPRGHDNHSDRVIFAPLDRRDATNPNIELETPYPGVFIYRFSEGYNYTNQAFHADTLMEHVTKNTRRLDKEDTLHPHDRLWNDPGPKAIKDDDHKLPLLKAIICDFSSVNNLDVTSVQGLSDLRSTLDRYAAPDSVEWHFANVHNRWTRRALTAAGFGYPRTQCSDGTQSWQPSYNIASVLLGGDSDDDLRAVRNRPTVVVDEERGEVHEATATTTVHDADTDAMSGITTFEVGSGYLREARRAMATVSSVDRPFFHVDLVDAVDAVVRNAQRRESVVACGMSCSS